MSARTPGRWLVLAAAAAVLPGAAAAQHVTDSAWAPAYRGFRAGVSYRAFAERARALQASAQAPLVCRTSRRTARLMECAVVIRDPTDSVAFRLAAHFIEGRAGFISLGDSGGAELVERLQAETRAVYGDPTAVARGTWEWSNGRRFVRLNWRGRGSARWAFVTLTDLDVLEGIAPYVTRTPGR